MIKVRKNPYKVLLDAFGEDVQFRCAVEEMGELIQAICKYKRTLLRMFHKICINSPLFWFKRKLRR